MQKKLEGVFREDSDVLLDQGFHIKFVTMRHNSPPHWHRALEFLFILNGNATVAMDGEKYRVNALEFLAIDATKVHDVVYSIPQTMGICIHVSREFLRHYIPDIELTHFECNLKTLNPEKMDNYLKLCNYMKELTVLYFKDIKSYHLQSNALLLQILAEMLDYFSTTVAQDSVATVYDRLARMEQIYHFVENNHDQEITLQDGADALGLNKDYFCRMFKASMGISFISYVNQVRIDHIFQDLLHTEDGVVEIAERHGFYNQKLFYRMFKKKYDTTPLQLRKSARANPAAFS